MMDENIDVLYWY